MTFFSYYRNQACYDVCYLYLLSVALPEFTVSGQIAFQCRSFLDANFLRN